MHIIWKKLFLVPNPTAFGLTENIENYFFGWSSCMFVLGFISLFALIGFYFFSTPTPRGVKRFWFMTLILGIFEIGCSIGYMILTYETYVGEPERMTKFNFLLSTVVSAFCNIFIVYALLLAIFLGLSQLNIPWNLRAMRRYPFIGMP